MLILTTMFNPYPSINDPEFYSKLISKKEIKNNAAKITMETQEDACDKSMFKMFEHQKLVRNFLSPHTPYQNLLLYHEVGSGKTCSAISIAEAHKDLIAGYNQKIMVILEDGVRQNFLNELYSDSKGDNQCTGTSYLNMTILERKKYIKSVYEFITLDKFTNEICRLSRTKKGRETIKDTYSNTLIIVDEVHNVREYDAIVSRGTDTNCKRYDALRNVVTIANDTKLLLMSATPMFDDPLEIVSLMNLFILNEQDNLELSDIPKFSMKTSSIFKKDGILSSQGKSILKKNLKGIVSYIRGDNPTTYPSMKFSSMSSNLGIFQKLKLVSADMSTFQRDGYSNLINSNENSIIIKQASNIFTGDMSDSDISDALKKRNLDNPEKSISMKFSKLLESLSVPGLAFVYSEFISGGLHYIREMLNVNGYEEYTENGKGIKPKYILLDGSTSAAKRSNLIQLFNHPDNKDGKFIKIVLGSAVLKEGITLKNVRNVHIMEPWYNVSRLKQVWGRAIRSCSHVALSPSKRNVNIFLYASTFKGGGYPDELIAQETYSGNVKRDIPYDVHFYKHSENKELKIERVERLLRSIAIDCELHKKYNRNSDDNIVCIPTKQVIDDTTYKHHDTFFNQPEVDHVIRIIKNVIKEHLFYEIKYVNDVINQAIFQLVPTKKDLTLFPHILKINKQKGYIIKRGKYLIFQPLDRSGLNKSNRERMSMYERKHPNSKIFKDIAYQSQRETPVQDTISGKERQKVSDVIVRKPKVTIVKSDSVRGKYRGLLLSNGNIKLQKIDQNITDNRVKSTGRLCTTFNGSDFKQLLPDIKIPSDLIKPFIKENANGTSSIKGKDLLCQTIVKYFYPDNLSVPPIPSSSVSRRGSEEVLYRATRGKFVFIVVKRNNQEVLKVLNAENTARGGNMCITLSIAVKKEIEALFPGIKFTTHKKFCNDIKNKLFS